MAAPTPKAPSVYYRHNVADARHEIGVKVGGYFVAFASLSDAYVAQLVENAAGRAEGKTASAEGEGE